MKLEEKVQLVFEAVLDYCIASREDGGPCINLEKGTLAATLADVVEHATVVHRTHDGNMNEAMCIKQACRHGIIDFAAKLPMEQRVRILERAIGMSSEMYTVEYWQSHKEIADPSNTLSSE